jgi:hypothetical protein
MLKNMPFAVVKMGAHSKPASAIHGKWHLTPKMRKTASSCLETVQYIACDYKIALSRIL